MQCILDFIVLKSTSHIEVIYYYNQYINFPKKHYQNIFSENFINELHAWIENHPHVINSPNVKDSVFVKINGTLLKKQNNLLQISVRELHNDMIFPSSEGVFSGAIPVDGNIYIGDTSVRKYMPKYIKPMSNRNNITCGWETCISAMLLKSDLDKWIISQLSKLDKLYINSASTKILEISKNNFIEYKK